MTHDDGVISVAFGPDGILFIGDTKSAAVFAIDTGRLNPETYECAERLRMKYGVRFDSTSSSARACRCSRRKRR